MPIFTKDDVEINYEVHGSGHPVLLLAPGGLRSSIAHWDTTPWNPIPELSDRYRVISMDQRNAGSSTGPITATSGWDMYTRDQLGLLNHLGVDSFHVMGMCIGGPFIMGLIKAAKDRVASAVAMQPIGLADNRATFYELFDGWKDEIADVHLEASESDWSAYRAAMFDGDFLFNASEQFVAECETPLLVLMGNDVYHPAPISRRVAELAPNAGFVENWKEPEHQTSAKAAVATFLAGNSRF